MNHIDLFTGIGGFTIAAGHCGLDTVAMCEVDDRCLEFLKKTYPNIPIIENIKNFNGEPFNGTFLLTAGVPCQPASRAGKQGGSEDDRWLWPDTLRVLGEVRPTWCLFENPPGIGDVGLKGILTTMETMAYKVRVFSIPACAASSPQKRERFWIVGNSEQKRRESASQSNDEQIKPEQQASRRTDADGPDVNMANPKVNKIWPRLCEAGKSEERGRRLSDKNGRFWENSIWVPCSDGKVRRSPDDSVELVDGLHRSILGALGNSIVPQLAERIINAMIVASGE